MKCDHEKCIEHCQEQLEEAKASATARHMEQARFHQAMAAAYRGRIPSAAQHQH